MHLSRQTAAESLFVVLAPIAGFFALSICLINQDRYVDPWFYTGYGQEFKTLQELFGWPYYAVRFPVILLNLAVPKGLDPVIGFAVVRYLVFLSCGVPLYLWARHYFGVAHAIAAYLFLFCNPLFLRVLLWDLTTFVSIPMALAGMTLWLLPTKFSALIRGLSGFAFCTSVASHAFTGTAIAVFFLVETTRRLIKRQYSDLILLDIVPPIVGAAVCIAIGITSYYIIIGPFDPSIFFTVTVNAIRAGDQFAASHNTPISVWTWQNTNALIPLALVGFIAIGFTRDLIKDSVVARVWWFGFLYCALFVGYQFVLNRFVLETFYYFAHLSLVVFLLFPVCLYLITRKLPSRNQMIVVGITIAMLITTAICKQYFIIAPAMLKQTVMSSEVLSIVGIILTIVAVYGFRLATKTASVACVYAVALVTIVQILTLSVPIFGGIYSNPQQTREYDVYRAAVEMVRLFASHARPSQKIMLWYPEKDTSISYSIVSTVLLYGINEPFKEGGMPNIGDYERSRLRTPKLKYIIMLSENSKLIGDGEDALTRNGFQFHEVQHQTIGGPTFKATLDMIELIR